jgi:hypothetical protein
MGYLRSASWWQKSVVEVLTRHRAPLRRLDLTEWERLCYTVGTGKAQASDGLVRLVIGAQGGATYCDAQLDDYSMDGVLRWHPPVRMSLRARVSHRSDVLRGTCGFGFWNDPLGMTTAKSQRSWLPHFRLPQAVWFFFAAPPSKMPWAYGLPSVGWKAATLDASRWAARLLLPFAPVGMLLCRWRPAYTLLWPWIQNILKIDEKHLPQRFDAWHDFRLEWHVGSVRGWIDDEEVLHTRRAPRGPLGLVIWMDNQYMVATPQGEIKHGLVATDEQWLEIVSLEVIELED